MCDEWALCWIWILKILITINSINLLPIMVNDEESKKVSGKLNTKNYWSECCVSEVGLLVKRSRTWLRRVQRPLTTSTASTWTGCVKSTHPSRAPTSPTSPWRPSWGTSSTCLWVFRPTRFLSTRYCTSGRTDPHYTCVPTINALRPYWLHRMSSLTDNQRGWIASLRVCLQSGM